MDALLRSDESYLRIIDSYYAALLHRDSEDAGQQFWLEHARCGLQAGLVAQRFLTSPEYYQRARQAVV